MTTKPEETLKIFYPVAKRVVEFFGRFEMHGQMTNEHEGPYGVAITVLQSEVVMNGRVMQTGSVAMVDSRCLILGEKRGVVYDPRLYYKQFPSEFREWMESNPHWPPKELRSSEYVTTKWSELTLNKTNLTEGDGQ